MDDGPSLYRKHREEKNQPSMTGKQAHDLNRHPGEQKARRVMRERG